MNLPATINKYIFLPTYYLLIKAYPLQLEIYNLPIGNNQNSLQPIYVNNLLRPALNYL